MLEQKATLGRIVMVSLDANYARLLSELGGSSYAVGQRVPAVIVHVWQNEMVNLKIFADAPSDLWITNVDFSPVHQARTWNWPERG
jgi:hypothetical protein